MRYVLNYITIFIFIFKPQFMYQINMNNVMQYDTDGSDGSLNFMMIPS